MAEQEHHSPHAQGQAQGEIEFDPRSHVPPFGPHLTLRARARRLGVIVATVLTALMGLLASVPAVRVGIASRVRGPLPSPTASHLAGDQFYFQPTAPWVTVLVDGQLLTHVPQASDSEQPLRFAPGTHTLEWIAPPFQPLRCQLTVPLASGTTTPPAPATSNTAATSDQCPLVAWESASGAGSGEIIDMRDSLAALDPTQQRALRAALQVGLDAAATTVTLAPGEYYGAPVSSAATEQEPVQVETPVRATLSLSLTSGWSEPCTLSVTLPCRFPTQDCQLICTLSAAQAPPSVPPTWVVAVPVTERWTYRAADGQVLLAAPGSPTLNYFLAVLTVGWDGTSWSATPSFGHTAGGDVGDSLACDVAREHLLSYHDATTGPLQFQLNLPTIGYRADATPSDGCVVGAVPDAGSNALFLERFGVLLAVNDVAARIAPGLPRATPEEQTLASQLLAG
jgi:hypothetical protein